MTRELDTERNRTGSGQVTSEDPRNSSSNQIPDQQLLDELRRLADEKGRAPTMYEMRADGNHDPKTYQRRFGRWSVAVSRVGLEVQQAGREIQISEKDVIDGLREFASELGRTPTSIEMDADGPFSTTPAKERFGSWNAAVRAAGLEPRGEMNISEERLLDEIRRLAEELGRPPSTNDLKRHGRFTHRAYFRVFDDWHSAVREAGYGPRGWPSGRESPQWKEHSLPEFYYGPNWAQQRQRAIQRDAFTCRMPGCETTREDHYSRFEKDLHVHHIVPVKVFAGTDDPDYAAMNHLENLVTLCAPHHGYWDQLSPLQPDIR